MLAEDSPGFETQAERSQRLRIWVGMGERLQAGEKLFAELVLIFYSARKLVLLGVFLWARLMHESGLRSWWCMRIGTYRFVMGNHLAFVHYKSSQLKLWDYFELRWILWKKDFILYWVFSGATWWRITPEGINHIMVLGRSERLEHSLNWIETLRLVARFGFRVYPSRPWSL